MLGFSRVPWLHLTDLLKQREQRQRVNFCAVFLSSELVRVLLVSQATRVVWCIYFPRHRSALLTLSDWLVSVSLLRYKNCVISLTWASALKANTRSQS